MNVGSVISSRFEIIRPLGSGSTASVFEARDRHTGEKAALKVLTNQATVDAADIERFKREAEVLSTLRHPHIVRMIGHGQTDEGVLYIAMEYLDGESLQVKLDRAQPVRGLPVAQAANYLMQIADALAAGHKNGIIHRDIKPSNVIIDSQGQAKLVDFGLARSITSSQGLTAPGEILGSGYYMSPEQHAGILVGYETDFDHRSDIYSLGVLAFALVVSSPPFADRTLDWSQLAALHTQSPIPAAAEASMQQIPKWYDRMIAIATAKSPADRFQSAREFAEFLKANLEGKTLWRSVMEFVTNAVN